MFTSTKYILMTKIIAIFIIAFTLFSCSSDDTNSETLKVLEKVVFYRDTPNERQWNFSNNLLQNITLADGTIAEEFTYDSQNRVVKDVKYTNGTTETDIITYNADNTISTINSLPYSYNAATKTYLYSYGSNFTINCEVNSDMLVVNFTRTGFNPGVFHMTYSDGNMTSFEKIANGTTEVLKNFNFETTLMDNPISEAVLAVARVKSLTDPNFFIDSQASQKVPVGFDKGSSDPYYYNYGAIPEDKLYQVGIEVLDGNNNFVNFYSFADYHYQ
jgi:hypothetical protein